MRVNSFSVRVPEGRERDSGHIEVAHNTVYTLRLGNHDYNRRCDAFVSVDGKEIGAFRINAGTTITLERPAHDQGRFTFFEESSQQAQEANIASIAKDNRGLIQVIFRPERKRQVQQEQYTKAYLSAAGEEKTSGMPFVGSIMPGNACGALPDSPSATTSTKTAGITGLTGQSNQTFTSVPNLDYEPNAEVTISLRLVTNTAVRELTPIGPRSNPVPDAI